MPARKSKRSEIGKVFIAGAGPGDPGLLTLRAKEALEQADVVIHDRLVHENVLKTAQKALLIDMGKRPYSSHGQKSAESQASIHRLLLEYAKKGKKVVRLKGGDPFVFGRGAEEAEVLSANGIPFDIIPGVSAGHAVPAYAGIPVTDRNKSSIAVFVTGHEDPGKQKSAVPWLQFGAMDCTIVSFMGIRNLPQTTRLLQAAGKRPSTKVTVIEKGTMPGQRVIEGTLSDIPAKVKEAGVSSPALVVIGEVNDYRKILKWYEKKPLFGKTVLITRAREQAGSLRQTLESEGARVLEFHGIRIAPPVSWSPLDDALRRLSDYHWIVFTSTNGVDAVFGRIRHLKKDARLFYHSKVAAIGEATRERLRENGIEADLVPERFHSTALLEQMKRKKAGGKSILLLRTDIAPEFLKKGLQKEGARVDEITVYRTLGPSREEKEKLHQWIKLEKIDFVTFTSGSTVRSLAKTLGQKKDFLKKTRLVSIGPVTTQALTEAGLRPAVEAPEHTIPGLVKALLKSKKK